MQIFLNPDLNKSHFKTRRNRLIKEGGHETFDLSSVSSEGLLGILTSFAACWYGRKSDWN